MFKGHDNTLQGANQLPKNL